jgi:energy-coupling factor transporter ATP-binding protein EcfA2
MLMQQPTLIPQPDSAASPPPTTDRDVQRATLRDLVALATECATTENEIERRYRIEVETESNRAERLLRDIARKASNTREQIRQTREQTIAQAEAAFAAEMKAIKVRDGELRRKIASRHDATNSEVIKKIEQAVWLAESVLENEQNGAAVEHKQAKALVETHRADLEKLEKAAAVQLAAYSTVVPEPEPADAEKEKAAAPKPELSTAIYTAQVEAAGQQLMKLGALRLPRLFVGITPLLLVFVLCAIAGVVTQLILKTEQPQWKPLGIAVGATFVAIMIFGLMLRRMSRRIVRETFAPFRQAISTARRATAGELVYATAVREHRLLVAHRRRKEEIAAAKAEFQPWLGENTRKRDAAFEAIKAESTQRFDEIQAARENTCAEATDLERVQMADVQQREQHDTQRAHDQHSHRVKLSKQIYDDSRAALSNRLNDGLAMIRVPSAAADGRAPMSWDDPAWATFVPPTEFPELVRFGEMTVDLRQIADEGVAHKIEPAPRSSDDRPNGHPAEAETPPSDGNGDGAATAITTSSLHLQLPPPFAVPATMAFPRLGSLLIQTDRDARPEAIRAMQMVMARLLTTIPPGRVRFTVIDPIGRGENFAGFMHLADHDDALIGGRIWTEQEQIEQRLADMTEHMETVIQKYLRNEYETIDQYNAQAGELAEPYRILVIADFPTGFEGDAARRLASVASSGARCGVYTLVLRDLRQPLPQGAHLDEIERNSINIVHENGKFVLKDDIFSLFPLTLDSPPAEQMLTGVLDIIGQAAKAAKRVELPFDSIAPEPEEFWSRSTAEELIVPVGRSGATKLQYVRLGRGVAQHVLIAGKTGSGKSTLLHAMVTNLAMWYSPDEVEFYLVDFKKGVEFKTYATHNLPHARAIAVESDREFGLSVLQRLDAELTRRGNLYRKVGTQDLAAYRQSPGALRMPRTLLIIDEFQEFFSEDDKLAQDANILLDRLVRQGRAFGIHVLLGSQTIGGSSGLPRSTIGQMAVRVALQTSEADSQLILGDNNSAARLLSRPGEAIYNDAGGLPENNSPFQVAWLPDAKREVYLDRVQQRAVAAGIENREPTIVFEGNAAADITRNPKLHELLDAPAWPVDPPATFAYLGDPVAIKDPSAVTFRRQAGANVLIIGQQDDAAMAIMSIAILSLAAQQAPGKAIFYIMDGTPADSSLVGVFNSITSAVPHEVKMVEYRLVPEAIDEIAKEVARRQAGGEGDSPSIYAFIYGMQRYRMLRKTDESFSFAASDAEKPPEPDKQFSTILREGPAFGVHIITWADTPATLERTLDRAALREFDNRILFQMSANDSSNLIDSPIGNKLGQNRALSYSEEQGVMEKFRPYAIPDRAWLARVREKLAGKK